MERLQKILARGGIASRRAAEELIVAGRVRVNGRVVTELGAKADERRDRIEVDGKRVVAENLVYAILHKPRGVVSTMSDPEGRPTVRELLARIGARVYPVGRLDFATSGVLLITNDGEFADALLHPRKSVPKTYVVKVKGAMTDDDLDVWRKGVRLEDGMTQPADLRLLRHEGDKTWFELTIREGRNQQIRRMGEATGFPVMRLARLSFAGVDGEGLPPGQFRLLTRDELITLKKTYGVPRSVSVAHAVEATGRGARGPRPTATPAARRGAAGRAARSFGKEAEGLADVGSERPRSRKPARDAGAETSRAPSSRFGGAKVNRAASTRDERSGAAPARGSSRGRTRTTGETGARPSAAKGRRGR